MTYKGNKIGFIPDFQQQHSSPKKKENRLIKTFKRTKHEPKF